MISLFKPFWCLQSVIVNVVSWEINAVMLHTSTQLDRRLFFIVVRTHGDKWFVLENFVPSEND